MSGVTKLMLRQTSQLFRVHSLNTSRQLLLPFSISSPRWAEPASSDPSPNESGTGRINENRSFDSIPVHLSSFGKVIMVLGGLHSRYSDVPDTVPNRVYQKTKDRFRARCVVASLFGTALLAVVAAMRGKRASRQGKRFTDEVFDMHRGESRLHEQIESLHRNRRPSDRYSPPIDEVNK